MATCKFCGKKTGLNPYCTKHKQQYYHERFPDRTCLECGEQLFQNGVSYSQFLKQIFCGGKCKRDFLANGVQFCKPVKEVGEFERTAVTIKQDDSKIQLIEDLVTKTYYTITFHRDKQIKSKYYSSPKEAIYSTMETQLWI